jgi:hypothetical protein
VVEALIFAAYDTGGLPAAWTFCRVVKLPMPEVAAWTDFAKRSASLTEVVYPQSVIEASADIASRLLKYQFKNPRLLQAALVRLDVTLVDCRMADDDPRRRLADARSGQRLQLPTARVPRRRRP